MRREMRRGSRMTLPFFLSLSLMSGCASIPVSECAWVQLIILDREDVLTRSTKEQVLQHNETVDRFCRRA